MTSTLDDIYSAEWVAHDFADLQPEFDVVGDSLVRQFRPRHVTDIGCGPGMMARRMMPHVATWRGIDGSAPVIAYAHQDVQAWIEHRDIITLERLPHGQPDRSLVICTEVAEHLESVHAPVLVRLLCSAMCPIVFTAAPPGQEGHHHVNCQPQSYWMEMFESLGAFYCPDQTEELRDRWSGLERLEHMRDNVMVFR